MNIAYSSMLYMTECMVMREWYWCKGKTIKYWECLTVDRIMKNNSTQKKKYVSNNIEYLV